MAVKPENQKPRNARQVIDLAFARSLKATSVEYYSRHSQAYGSPLYQPGKRAFEGALAGILNGLAAYVDAYQAEYPDSKLGLDGVLGEAWADGLRGFRALLNGELGRLDGGALDAAACDLWAYAGFTEEL